MREVVSEENHSYHCASKTKQQHATMPHQHNSTFSKQNKKNTTKTPAQAPKNCPQYSWLFFRFAPEDILPFAAHFMARTTYIKAPELSPLRRYQAPPQHSFRGIRRWRNRPSHGDVECTWSWRKDLESWGNPKEILGSLCFFLLKDRNFEYVSWCFLMLLFCLKDFFLGTDFFWRWRIQGMFLEIVCLILCFRGWRTRVFRNLF